MLDMWVILLLPCYFAERRADRASLRLNTHGGRRYALRAYAPLRPAMCSTAARSVRIRRAGLEHRT